jgi:hypothetical protein
MIKNGNIVTSSDGSITFKIYLTLLNFYKITICPKLLSPLKNLQVVIKVKKLKKKK